jgi:pimeloyl-ACP methyl ester carboxylesterase
MQTERVDADGTRLYVRRWGSPDGQPLLFLHSLGAAASAALIDVGMGPLAEAGWSIAAPDMPGYGESPVVAADQYEIPRLAELVVALADALGWDRFVLGGHSWGGAIAVHLAAAHPERVRALVLVDSGHIDYANDPNGDITKSLDELVEDAESKRIRVRDRASVATDLELDIDDPIVDSYLAGLMDDGEGGLISRTPGAARGAAMYHLMRSKQTEQWPAIAAAGIPTLLLLATVPEDRLAENQAGAEAFQAAIPAADVRFLDGTTHSLITDLRDRFGEITRDWLAERPA